jgi:ATP-binding cassette subfamily E protein 1
MNKHCVVDFSLCSPEHHDPETGLCVAAGACEKRVLEQEDPFQAPFLMSNVMCSGCGKCAAACPLDALSVESG